MLFSVDLIAEHFVEHNVFSAPEEVLLNLRVGLLEHGDEILGLKSLGTEIARL